MLSQEILTRYNIILFITYTIYIVFIPFFSIPSNIVLMHIINMAITYIPFIVLLSFVMNKGVFDLE